jgi:hypothetical protein
MIPSEWLITTRGIEGATPNPRPGKPALTCGAGGTGAGTPAKPWDRRRNGASRHRVCQACFIAGSLLLCTAGWLRSAAANPPPDANSVGSRGTTTILASLVAEARRSVFLSPGLRSCLPFALSINGKSKRANSAPPARASRPLDAAAEHAENLFRRACVGPCGEIRKRARKKRSVARNCGGCVVLLRLSGRRQSPEPTPVCPPSKPSLATRSAKSRSAFHEGDVDLVGKEGAETWT